MSLPARLLVVAALLCVVTAHEAAPALGRPTGGTPVALVTAAGENEVLAVSMPGGRVLRRVHLRDPETIVTDPKGVAVVVSPTGRVTLLDWRTLKVLAVLRGFGSPQVAAITPDGEWVYVTDATTGELSVIELARRRVVDRIHVGANPHSVAVSPNLRRAWIALGERADTIVVLDTLRVNRPRVIGRIHSPVPADDLAFAPDSQTVWVCSATSPYVSVLNAETGRLVTKVPAGPGPQHIAFGLFAHPRAFIASDHGSTLEAIDIDNPQGAATRPRPARIVRPRDRRRARRHHVARERRRHRVDGHAPTLDGRLCRPSYPRRRSQRLVSANGRPAVALAGLAAVAMLLTMNAAPSPRHAAAVRSSTSRTFPLVPGPRSCISGCASLAGSSCSRG